MSESTTRIWLGDLGKYNEGELVGEWIELPMDPEELTKKVHQYSNGGTTDYFLADWEPGNVPEKLFSEHSSPWELNQLAQTLADYSEHDLARVNYLVEDVGVSFADALVQYEDVTFYEGMNLTQVAESLVDDGCFGEIPESIQYFIDFEKIGRELRHDGYTETNEGVFHYA
jgi:antirestriction protein